MPAKKISNCKICGKIPEVTTGKNVSDLVCKECCILICRPSGADCIDIWNKLNSTGIEIGDTLEINGAVYEYQAIQSVGEDTPIMIPDNEPLSKILPINCCSECGRAYDVKRTKT